MAAACHLCTRGDAPPTIPLAARFSPRLARELFVSLLMHCGAEAEGDVSLVALRAAFGSSGLVWAMQIDAAAGVKLGL